jgi:hypothetical protein
VLHNYNEKVLKFATAPPNLKRSVKVKARYEIPLITQVKSYALYSKYHNLWLDGIIADQELCDLTLAKQTAAARMAQTATGAGHLRCSEAGLEPGQTIRIVNTPRQIDDVFLIRSVTTSFENDEPQFTVTFGAYVPDLVTLLIELRRKRQFIPERPGEQVTADMIVLDAAQGTDAAAFSKTLHSGAYNFDDDAYFDFSVFDGGS